MLYTDYALMRIAKDRQRETERMIENYKQLRVLREERAQQYAAEIHEAREDLRRERYRSFRRHYT
jgi:hypothetical protein